MGLFIVSSTLAPEYLLNLLLLQQNVLIKFNLFTPKLSTFSDLELGFSKFLVQILELLLSLWTLCTVLRTTLCAVCNTCGIKSTTNDVITYTWKVLNTTTANQHD